MPYNPGTMLQMLGQASENAGAPLPLDRIRARRMQREAAELEEFKADTQRKGVNEQVASGKETRRINKNAEAYQKILTQELNKLPVIPANASPDDRVKLYISRMNAATSHWDPSIQKMGEEMAKNLPNIQKASPLNPNTMAGAEIESQNQRREDQTDIDKQKLTLGYAKLADDKKSAKAESENQRLSQVAINDKIYAAKQTLLQNGYDENSAIPQEDRFRFEELVNAQMEAKRPYIIPREWRNILAMAKDALESGKSRAAIDVVLRDKGVSPYLLDEYISGR